MKTCASLQDNSLPKTAYTPKSSAAAFRARISALPEKARDWLASDQAYGSSLLVSLAKLDHNLLWWKTSHASEAKGLVLFSETWPRSGMMRNGIAYQLPPLAPLTKEIASGLLPIPTVEDGESKGMSAARLATCRPDNLATLVRCASPAARDYRSGRGRSENGHTPQLPEQVGGRLNPTWVEWLMGFPKKWTAVKD